MFSNFSSNPAPDFSRPVELLKACHDKINYHCELLVTLCSYLQQNPVDSDAQKTANQILRYFSTAANLHHEDEEINLFPMLLDNPKLSEKNRLLIEKLQHEHSLLETDWLVFEKIIREEELEKLSGLAQKVDNFNASYLNHIESENNILLPEAEKLLSEQDLHTLGTAMRLRRQG